MESEPFSIGTTPILSVLNTAIIDQEYPIDTLIINLGVFIRNCSSNQSVKDAIEYDKLRGIETTRPSEILVEAAKAEMVNFIQYFTQVLNNAPSVHNPVIIAFHANYAKCIPQEIYREPVHSKRVITIADELFRSRVLGSKRREATSGKVRIVELPLNDNHCPWRYLQEELRDCKNEHLVGMISNHPVDYHIGPVCRTFRLFRSYTANVVWYKNLGGSVFDTDLIPFNIYTHAVLGDKEDVKSMVRGAAKTKLLSIAEEEEWSLKTQDYIRERFYKLSIHIPTNF